jgi:archaellin
LETSFHASNNDTLASKLGINTTFSLEVIPPKGAVLFIERTTPVYWDTTNSLN